MEQVLEQKSAGFVDRRQSEPVSTWAGGFERRQFGNSYNSQRQEVNELAMAIDQYKLRHRRRFITFEELYDVITALGYRRAT
jgi:hypothetical protein